MMENYVDIIVRILGGQEASSEVKKIEQDVRKSLQYNLSGTEVHIRENAKAYDELTASLKKVEAALARQKTTTKTLREEKKALQNVIATLGKELQRNNQHYNTLNKTTTSATSSISAFATKLGFTVTVAYTLRKALRELAEAATLGIKTMDQMRLQAASMAGASLIAQPTMDFNRALGNANALIEKTIIMSRAFVGTARELLLLAEAAVTFGVKLDFTTKKGKDDFIAFANILKLITQGQNFEIQAFQEVRAIMQGQNFQGAMLARRLQAVGVNVREMVPLWVRQGTLIEEVNKRLSGYGQATESIKMTLGAQLKTLKSIVSITLAHGAGWTVDPNTQVGAYADIRNAVVKINDLLMDENQFSATQKDIVEKIKGAWEGVKDATYGTVNAVYNIYLAWDKVTSVIEDVLTTIIEGSGEVFGLLSSKASAFGKLLEEKIPSLYDILGAAGALGLITKIIELLDKLPLKSKQSKEPVRGFVPWAPALIYRGLDELGLIKDINDALDEQIKKNNELAKAEADRIKAFRTTEALQWKGPAVALPRNLTEYLQGQEMPDIAQFRAITPAPANLPETPEQERERIKAEKLLWEKAREGEVMALTRQSKLLGDIRRKQFQELEKDFKLFFTFDIPTGEIIPTDAWDTYRKGYGLATRELVAQREKDADQLLLLAFKVKDAIEKTEIDKWRKKFAEDTGNIVEDTYYMFKDLEAVTSAGGDKFAREMEMAHIRAEKSTRGLEKSIQKLLAKPEMQEPEFADFAKELRLALRLLDGPIKEMADKVETLKVNEREWDRVLAKLRRKKELAYFTEPKDLERVTGLQLQITALRKEAEIPVKWPWEDQDAIDRATKLADLQEKLGKDLQKVAKVKDPETRAQLAKEFKDAYSDMAKKVIEETDSMARIVGNTVQGLFTDMRGFAKDIFFDTLKGEWSTLSDYVNAFTDIVRNAWANMLADMVQRWIQAKFGDMIQKSFSSVGSGIMSIFSGGGPMNAIEALDSFFTAEKGGVLPGKFVPIQAFAGGGIARQPTLGMIAEKPGLEEAVIPLAGGKVPVEMRGNRGGEQNISINFNINAVDTRGIDKLLYERKNMITGMIVQELRNAGGTRDAIRRHV